MPNARPQCCCQAPQPRSGAPKAQGLIAALWPQHNPPCRRPLHTAATTEADFYWRRRIDGDPLPAVKLHLLDGRDLEYLPQTDPLWHEYWDLYCLLRLAVKDNEKIFESNYASLILPDPPPM